MEQLRNIIQSSDSLANGLRINGSQHQNYKMYTSMERALGTLISGYIYLSNGNTWNDVPDHYFMETKNAFATCFSCSTKENIAMWMLYGAEHGKNGAMLNFYPSVLKELMNSEIVEMGAFDHHKQFTVQHILKRSKKDFEIFLSDVVYVDECKNGKFRLTCGDEHVIAEGMILDHRDIFIKNYAWSYEKECRLIVRPSQKWYAKSSREHLSAVRLKLSSQSIRKMQDGRLIRSPIYSGGVSFGIPSALTDDVSWEL